MFFIYGIGIPLTAFILLYRSRHKLNNIEIKRYFLVLYQGLKPRVFYWEFVNTSRKVTILIVVVFLAQASVHLKALLIVLVVVIFFRLQIFLSPYKLPENNALERLEMTTGLITLYGGLLFISENDREPVIDLLVFMFIIVCNINFVINWIYNMLCTFRNVHSILDSIIVCVGFLLCKQRFKPENMSKLQKPKTPKVLIMKSGKKVKVRRKRRRPGRARKEGKKSNREAPEEVKEQNQIYQNLTKSNEIQKGAQSLRDIDSSGCNPIVEQLDPERSVLKKYGFGITRKSKKKKNRRFQRKKTPPPMEMESAVRPAIVELNEDSEFFMTSNRSRTKSISTDRQMEIDSSRHLNNEEFRKNITGKDLLAIHDANLNAADSCSVDSKDLKDPNSKHEDAKNHEHDKRISILSKYINPK